MKYGRQGMLEDDGVNWLGLVVAVLFAAAAHRYFGGPP
jgi:hypothetical protein